jgi:hypothetical protein
MSAPSSRTLFVTTALPYANAPFHIGHIMEYVQADIWVRFQRMQGHRVHFVCADDAHGAPIMLQAESEGISPETLIARVGESHRQDWARYRISFDTTHSTHSPENVELAQSIYRALRGVNPAFSAPGNTAQITLVSSAVDSTASPRCRCSVSPSALISAIIRSTALFGRPAVPRIE